MLTLISILSFLLFVIASVLLAETKFSFLNLGTELKRFRPFLFVFLGLSFIGIFSGSLFFYSQPGHQYHLAYPTGGESAVLESGIKPKLFARTQEWQQFVDIKTIESDTVDVEHVEGIIQGGIPVRFIDQVRAHVFINVRIKMPSDPVSFITIAKQFRHPKNLVVNTLIPTIRETVINTAYMYKAQDYITGSSSDFRFTIEDQLKNGNFKVKKIEHVDSVISKIENNNRIIKEPQIRYDVEKLLDKSGKPLRVEHDITKNNIIVVQVNVTDVVLEPAFRKRLEVQRDLVSKKRMELQKIENAEVEQKRIIAEGERDKAAERAQQEKQQVKELIEIETKLKKEETNRKLAKIQLETERLNSQKIKVIADAEAARNAKLVRAGLTPQERAQIEKEIAIGVATQISKIKLPEVYINGKGGGNNKGILYDILGADYAKTMKKTK